MRLFIFVVVVAIFFSCTKEDPPAPNNPNTTADRTIKVFVKHIYELQPDPLDSAVAGATVKLYKTYQDREDDFKPDAIRTTDANGVAKIPGRQHDYYYIKVHHPALGTQYEETSAPAGTISLVYIDYY